MILLYILLGLFLGGVGVWLGLRPHLKRTIEEDKRVVKENELRHAELENTQRALATVQDDLNNIRTVFATEKVNVANLHSQITEATQEIDTLRRTKERINDEIALLYEKNDKVKETAADALEKDLDRIREDYEQARLAAEQEYVASIEVMSQQMHQAIKDEYADLETVEKQVEEARAIITAINDEKQRAETDASLYMLGVTADDLVEIRALRDVAKTFRDATPVNKLIWSLYYQKPYKDLVIKYLGDKKICGIYSITDTIDARRYIGQSVDVGARWADHIKRGLGADKGADTKLYTAMKRDGVENFKFELLEEVERDRLNEQEKFWINFFGTDKLGLNSTKGGS